MAIPSYLIAPFGVRPLSSFIPKLSRTLRHFLPKNGQGTRTSIYFESSATCREIWKAGRSCVGLLGLQMVISGGVR